MVYASTFPPPGRLCWKYLPSPSHPLVQPRAQQAISAVNYISFMRSAHYEPHNSYLIGFYVSSMYALIALKLSCHRDGKMGSSIHMEVKAPGSNIVYSS
jgi:hypothetical protein